MGMIINDLPGVKVFKGEHLAKYTSLNIGGIADYVVIVRSKKRLSEVLRNIRESRRRFLIIGRGTNVLFSRHRFRGVVVKLAGDFNRIRPEGNRLICGAGASLNAVVKRSCHLGLRGAEFLAGIPGTVGGAVKGNAGAWGRAIGDIVERITVFDLRLVEQDRKRDDLEFGYRRSNISDQSVVTSVKLRLIRGDRRKIARLIKENLRLRNERQPRGRSAGSFFKNPPGNPAGKLIEDCGLKGYSVGDAAVSRKHGNFVINRGKASAADVLKLARHVEQRVYKTKGVRLKPEVRIIR